MSSNLSPILRLTLPPFDTAPWDQVMNNNLLIIDGAVGKFFNQANFIGVWKNSTAFIVGQVVFDSTDSSEWTCNVSHTSAATGTFAADRAAHPTFWTIAANSAQSFAAAAAQSASQAAGSATAAAASLKSFQGQYYGASATDPTVDPTGAAPTDGDLYFHSVAPIGMRVRSGTAWIAVASGVPEAPLDTNAWGRSNGTWVTVLSTNGGRVNNTGGTNAVPGTLVIGPATVPAGSAPGLLFADELEAFNHTINLTHDGAGVFHQVVAGSTPFRIHPTAANTVAFAVAPTGTAGSVAALVDAMTINNLGNFTILGTATKPGGGTWIAPSDSRIKNVIGPYTVGLAELDEMIPQHYTYKGNDNLVNDDGSMGPPANTDTTTVHIGLIGQDCEGYMPELVTQYSAYIDGVLETDVRQVNATAVTMALVNAVKTLLSMINGLSTVPVPFTMGTDTNGFRVDATAGGYVWLSTADGNPSQGIYLKTSPTNGSVNATGQLAIETGNVLAGSAAVTGTVYVGSGANAGTGDSGDVFFYSGDTTAGSSGNIYILPGAAVGAGKKAGDITVDVSGSNSGGAAPGRVFLKGLPGVDPHVVDQLWLDGDVLKVSLG